MAPKAKKTKVEHSEMRVFVTSADMRAWSREQRKMGKRVAFVPTMVSEHTASVFICKYHDCKMALA